MGAPALQTSAADDPWAFQTDLVHQIEAALGNHASVLLQLPTGGGKTHVAAAVIRRWNARRKRVWFVCHTRELIQQTCAKLDALGVSHGVVSPEYEPCYERRVQVCSVDTLRSRIEKLGDLLQDPDLIVWDECQHVAAPSWSAIKERYAKAKHLGLTATPERLDGTGLGQWFDHLICGPTTRDLIVRGRLSRYRLFTPTIPDLRGVKTLAGDYAARDLDERMGGSVLVGDVVEHYRKLAPGARAIVFAVSVKHSKAVVERFQAAGIPAAHVDGTTRKDDRDAAVERLASGEIKVLSNVRVFTEGFDVPAIDAVIVLRPTKSRALFLQMIGRGLREAEGKSATIVLDHAGAVYEHGLPDDDYEWTLEGRSERGAKKPLGGRLRRCPECNAVHEWAAECVECGHTYAAGDRTIDEVYGELREVWRDAPAGYVSMLDFSKLVGIPYGSVYALIKRGLPVAKHFGVTMVEATAGIEWYKRDIEMASTRAAVPEGYQSRQDFAKTANISTATLDVYRSKGLPSIAGEASSGPWARFGQVLIPVNEGLDWLKSHRSERDAKRHKAIKESGEKFEPLAAFARRMGVNHSIVYRAKQRGLPCIEGDLVDVAKATPWFKKYRDRSVVNCRPFGSEPGEYEPQGAFAARLGLTRGQIKALIRAGLPQAANGWVHVAGGLEWFGKAEVKFRRSSPRKSRRPQADQS